MKSFDNRMSSAVSNSSTKGWLVSILELGAWFGTLCTGYLADKLSRKYTIVLGGSFPLVSFLILITTTVAAVVIFCVGVAVQTTAFQPSSIYGGQLLFPLTHFMHTPQLH